MIKAYARTDKGNVRENNEDYFYISNSLDEVQFSRPRNYIWDGIKKYRTRNERFSSTRKR